MPGLIQVNNRTACQFYTFRNINDTNCVYVSVCVCVCVRTLAHVCTCDHMYTIKYCMQVLLQKGILL